MIVSITAPQGSGATRQSNPPTVEESNDEHRPPDGPDATSTVHVLFASVAGPVSPTPLLLPSSCVRHIGCLQKSAQPDRVLNREKRSTRSQLLIHHLVVRLYTKRLTDLQICKQCQFPLESRFLPHLYLHMDLIEQFCRRFRLTEDPRQW